MKKTYLVNLVESLRKQSELNFQLVQSLIHVANLFPPNEAREPLVGNLQLLLDGATAHRDALLQLIEAIQESIVDET